MYKLWLVTIGERSFHCGSKSWKSITDLYPTAKKIELLSDNLMVNDGDRYKLLEQAYKHIVGHIGVDELLSLKQEIEKHLGIIPK